MLFNFQNARFDYEPFPICYVKDVFAPDVYEALAASYPSLDQFLYMPKLGKKYSLAPLNNGENYHAFLAKTPLWKRLHDEVKGEAFVRAVLDMMCAHGVDLGLRERLVMVNSDYQIWKDRVRGARDYLKTGRPGRVPIKTRFEFSMMPADGGHIKPHTDNANKLITLVVSMIRPGEWDDAHGGGTATLRCKDESQSYNQLNRQLEFDQVSELQTFPFVPNQCVIFVKTFNSWHAVYPMTGHGSQALRKTLTINIETH